MPTPTPRQPKPAPLPPGSPRHARAAAEPTTTASGGSAQTVLQQRLQGAFLTIIGIAGLIGGVLFSIEAPRFTPVPVVFLTFWLVMVIVGKILFAGLSKLREAGVGAPAPQQVRAAAAVAGIVVAVGMMGFAATGTGAGVAAAAPCPGGGPATCGPTGPELTFAPPTGQATAPGQQPGQQGGQDQNGIATSPAQGGDNGPGIQAQTPQFGTPGQQAPNIPGNEQPGQGGSQQGQQPQGNGQGQPNQNPTVQTTAPGGPQQTGQQQPGQTSPGQPSSPTVTVTKTESQCAVPGAGNGAGTPGSLGGGDSSDNGGGTGPDNGDDGDNKDGAPSWAYLVGEVTALMTGRRGRKAGPLNPDGSAPTNDMIPNDQVDGENYKLWTTPDGDRTYILSENKDAPSQYRFALNQPHGGTSKINDDGSASVFDRDGNQVKRFEKPWAFDVTNANRIPTTYRIDGDDLVQTIDRPEGNDNAIIADPFAAPESVSGDYAVAQAQSIQINPAPPTPDTPLPPHQPLIPDQPNPAPSAPIGSSPGTGGSEPQGPTSEPGSSPGSGSGGAESPDEPQIEGDEPTPGDGGSGNGAGLGDWVPPVEPEKPEIQQVFLPLIGVAAAAAIIDMILALILAYIALVGLYYAMTHRDEMIDFITRQLPGWIGDQADRIRDTVGDWFAANTADAESVQKDLNALPKGDQDHVRVLPDDKAVEDWFNDHTKGAEELDPGTYPGKVRRLPDGTIIRMRDGSKSGGKTIDIQIPGQSGKNPKIHVGKPK